MFPVVTLRAATINDEEMLFVWRNDPTTQNASHTSKAFTRTEHRKWLLATLADPHRKLYIGEEGGVPIGTVRADYTDDAWTLSWTVAPESRGRSLGKHMVASLASQIDSTIKATIKADNIASLHIARYIGMVCDHKQDGMLHFYRPPRNRDMQ